jgi:hypothetical protein
MKTSVHLHDPFPLRVYTTKEPLSVLWTATWVNRKIVRREIPGKAENRNEVIQTVGSEVKFPQKPVALFRFRDL